MLANAAHLKVSHLGRYKARITFGPHLVGRYNAAAGPLGFKPKTVETVGKSRHKAA